MAKQIEGALKAEGRRFCIIVSRFNSFITERLIEGAMDALLRHGAKDEDITLIRVPGSFEIPAVLRRYLNQASKPSVDAVICLGAVIRGGTPHFDYVASEVSKGIAHIALDSSIPVAFGVLTCDTIEQAIERAGSKAGNKGFEAASTAIEMADLFKQL